MKYVFINQAGEKIHDLSLLRMKSDEHLKHYPVVELYNPQFGSYEVQ